MMRYVWPLRRKELYSHLESLPPDELRWVEVAPYQKRLPANLRSRIKILVRELGAFNGICYEEMNGLVHKMYYPKRDRIIGGQVVESSIPTNELTPDEARIIESELYDLGSRIQCPLSLPQAK